MDAEVELILIDERDNVAVAVTDLRAGSVVRLGGLHIEVAQDLPFGHKVALRPIHRGEEVLKYGCPIGRATADIAVGEWVHSHNLRSSLAGSLDYAYEASHAPSPGSLVGEDFFEGYERPDGSVGTRNEIWIIPTVACVNHTVKRLEEVAQARFGHLCEGIHAFPHNAGCSQLGEDHEMTQRLLAAIIRHPNAGGCLVVSLGCENNDLAHFKPVLGEVDPDRVKFLITQDVGDEVEAGLALIGDIVAAISTDHRHPVPARKLVLGLKCGASDGLSGITANPLCGRIADRLCAEGGSAILTEVPEMFGAEALLMNRADSRETFDAVAEMIKDFKRYFLDHGQPIDENPSPGNKTGGITTLEEKSLGCIQKGGSSIVAGTLGYGETCRRPGLSLLTGPGNDNVSITNILASGAQLILFTTGRGTPLGTAVPTIKIASNDRLFERKRNWIDFNAGPLLSGASMDALAEELWRRMLDVASGRAKAQNERDDYREIMIFKNGVLL